MKTLSRELTSLPVTAALAMDLEAARLRKEGRRVISFCIGEPDFDTPEPIIEAGCEALRSGKTHYTHAAGMPSLKEAAAAMFLRDYGVSYAPADISVTPGAKYAVYAAVRVLTNPGDEILLPAPYWTSYIHIIRLCGGVPVIVPTCSETGWKITPADIRAFVTPRTKAIILNNPGNPSGAVYTRAEAEALTEEICRQDLFCVSDEIYGQLVFGEEAPFAMAALSPDMRSRTVTVNGVSKAYAMTGWRIGFAAAEPPVSGAIRAFLSHTSGSSNTAAQYAAVRALTGPQDPVLTMRDVYRARRDTAMEILGSVPGLSVTAPQGAFYMMPQMTDELKQYFPDAAAFAAALLTETGTAVVPCTDYGLGDAFRLSLTLPEPDASDGLRAIARFVRKTMDR